MGGANAPAYDTSPFAPAYLYGLPSADAMRIDDLLDLSKNNDLFSTIAADVHHHNLPLQPDDVSTPIGSRSVCFSESFADDILMPNEEAAELEWLSKFVEDSFSAAPYPPAPIPNNLYSNAQDIVTPDAAGRGARSKRSRADTASNWPSQQQTSSSTTSSDFGNSRPKRNVGGADNGVGADESGVRRCTHCASERTPQWRAGPLGPKTLCNACGVRYKSGRLVPEYRPAASPSFVLAQHSNSHRKVVELRRQKEGRRQHRLHQP